ncbi:hypothetical protein [Microbacterium hominis]|uniref:Uncharacterized protein n=1 Tax=Microbacterium hominis TaxID=162426 RepID=A0A7D4QK73_9MICO|nr:hypothetical protein [Microbacterium hominis]QKJ20276.1 hypothetical protein HQM25_13525 [Microbacterium hominis]
MTSTREPNPLSRRAFVRLALATAPAAALAACAAEPTAQSAPSPTASTPTPTSTSTPTIGSPAALSARPAVIRSFGPNGTHWPSHTPWVGETIPKVVEVACSWSAIATAIKAVTSSQAAAGVHITVRPGTLPGVGASSGSTAVLQNVGNAAWTKNVLVSPRDGWGTVKIGDAARLRDVRGVTFARIDGTDVLLTNCTRTAWAQSKMSKGLRMASSYGATTTGCGAYEIVMSGAKADIADPLGYAAGKGCVIKDCVWEGCYCAPVFRPTGADDHVDSLQMYGSGWYRGLTVRDTTFFGSLNCALQIGGMRTDDPNKGTPFLTVDHCILTSQATAMRVRYPKPSNADTPKLTQAINGIGEPGQLHAKDSYIFGSMYRSQWGTVSNTRVSYADAASRNPVASGRWTVDTGMDSWTAADFDRLTPTPTDAYLKKIWS